MLCGLFVRWPHGSHSLGLCPSLQNGRKPPPMSALHQRFVPANSQLGGAHRRKQIPSLARRLGGRTSALEACKICRAWGRLPGKLMVGGEGGGEACFILLPY